MNAQDYAKVGVEDLADKQKLFRLIKSVNSQLGSGGGWDSPAASPAPMVVMPSPKQPTPFHTPQQLASPHQPAHKAHKADILDLDDDETDLLGEVSLWAAQRPYSLRIVTVGISWGGGRVEIAHEAVSRRRRFPSN